MGLSKKSQKSLIWKVGALILVTSFVLMIILNIHPGIVIAILLLLALFLPIKNEEESE